MRDHVRSRARKDLVKTNRYSVLISDSTSGSINADSLSVLGRARMFFFPVFVETGTLRVKQTENSQLNRKHSKLSNTCQWRFVPRIPSDAKCGQFRVYSQNETKRKREREGQGKRFNINVKHCSGGVANVRRGRSIKRNSIKALPSLKLMSKREDPRFKWFSDIFIFEQSRLPLHSFRHSKMEFHGEPTDASKVVLLPRTSFVN